MDDLAFLQDVKEYIEGMEVAMENEYGSCRDLPELIANGLMPALYRQTLERLEVYAAASSSPVATHPQPSTSGSTRR
jgi:hypothetical protein